MIYKARQLIIIVRLSSLNCTLTLNLNEVILKHTLKIMFVKGHEAVRCESEREKSNSWL